MNPSPVQALQHRLQPAAAAVRHVGQRGHRATVADDPHDGLLLLPVAGRLDGVAPPTGPGSLRRFSAGAATRSPPSATTWPARRASGDSRGKWPGAGSTSRACYGRRRRRTRGEPHSGRRRRSGRSRRPRPCRRPPATRPRSCPGRLSAAALSVAVAAGVGERPGSVVREEEVDAVLLRAHARRSVSCRLGLRQGRACSRAA
jgi:hypothetical protein